MIFDDQQLIENGNNPFMLTMRGYKQLAIGENL